MSFPGDIPVFRSTDITVDGISVSFSSRTQNGYRMVVLTDESGGVIGTEFLPAKVGITIKNAAYLVKKHTNRLPQVEMTVYTNLPLWESQQGEQQEDTTIDVPCSPPSPSHTPKEEHATL